MSTLKELISEGEHLQQDFKFRIDDQKKIARTLCAFANTAGGRLLIGVKDNGKITGIDPHEEFHMIEGAAQLFCKPEIKFKSIVWQEDYKMVLEINVDKSVEGPHRSPDESGKLRPYVRIEDQTIAANKILERVWIARKSLQSKPEKFDADEMLIVKLIGLHEPLTISKLYRIAELPLKQVDRILVMLICWDLVEMKITRESVVYTLKEEAKKS